MPPLGAWVVPQVLRLICLQCTVNNGLKPRVLEAYKRDIIHTYGYQHFITLENLEKAGLLYAHQGRSTYAVVRKTLQLTVDDVSEHNPTDIAYVHSGYVCGSGGWAGSAVTLRDCVEWQGRRTSGFF